MTEVLLGSILPGNQWQGVGIPVSFTGLLLEFTPSTGTLEEISSILLVRRTWVNATQLIRREEARRVYPRYGDVVLLDFPVVYASDLEPNEVEVTKRYLNKGYAYQEPNWLVRIIALTTTSL